MNLPDKGVRTGRITYPDDNRTARVRTVLLGTLLAFSLIAISLLFWTVLRSQFLSGREDNPRTVEAELRIRRGRILDNKGVVLAETIGPPGEPVRNYPLGAVGPAVGYYSFRHGTAGVEEGYDALLRGNGDDFWDAFSRQHLHEVRQGRDIRLAIDAEWQRNADALLAGEKGAAVLMTIPDGGVRIMASQPSYVPSQLDDQFEELLGDDDAPLLNRVTQGQYQPGLALQPLLIAAASEAGLLTLGEEVANPAQTMTIHGVERGCLTPPQSETWEGVLQSACPSPLRRLAEIMDEGQLVELFRRFGLMSQPELPLAVARPGAGEIVDLKAAMIGQDELTISPMQALIAWSTLGNGGLTVEPHIVSAIQTKSGEWQFAKSEADAAGSSQEPVVGQSVAESVLKALPRHGEVVAEHTTLALAGPGGATNAWYMGLAPAGAPHFAIVVIIEDTEDVTSAREIGRTLLLAALNQTS